MFFDKGVPKNSAKFARKQLCWILFLINTAWKVSKYGVISDWYFPVFDLNTGVLLVLELMLESDQVHGYFVIAFILKSSVSVLSGD